MECVLSIVDQGDRLEVLVATIGGGVIGNASVPGPANPRFIVGASHGLKRKLETIVARASAGLDDAICLSVAAALPADPDFLRETLAELVPIDRERVLLCPYERAALAGSIGGTRLESAIVVRADVGSRGWGVSASGREASRGGFGEVLGDEGSAYWIGSLGVRAALKAFEKRSRNTILKERLLRHFEVDSHAALVRPEHEVPAIDRYAIAGFAREVFGAAREDDDFAVETLEQAGRELASLGLALVNELDLLDNPFQVLPCGAVFRLRGGCLETFIKVLKTKTTKANLLQEGMGATAGGVLLAIQHLGLKLRPETPALLESSLRARAQDAGG